jgi:hypothetical protein
LGCGSILASPVPVGSPGSVRADGGFSDTAGAFLALVDIPDSTVGQMAAMPETRFLSRPSGMGSLPPQEEYSSMAVFTWIASSAN